jgi:cell division protein FtsQ
MKTGRSNKNKKTAAKAAPGLRKKLAAAAAKLKYLLPATLVMTAAVWAVWFFSHSSSSPFRIRTVEFSGNEHLTDEELRHISGLRGNESLLALPGRKVYEKLKESPWIQAAAVRKEYPSKLLIRISETEPLALLDMKGKMFIVDDKGRMLEELRDNSVPFLPVILSDPYTEKEAFREAVDLAKAVRTMGMLHTSQRIEIIAHNRNEIAANLDGMYVKIGAGEYEDKLARLLEIGEEIRKRNMPVAYLDLRFAKKVVVKPVNEVIR